MSTNTRVGLFDRSEDTVSRPPSSKDLLLAAESKVSRQPPAASNNQGSFTCRELLYLKPCPHWAACVWPLNEGTGQ